MNKKIYLITGNKDKYNEIKNILGNVSYKIKMKKLDLKEIQSLNVIDVVIEKVKDAYKIIKNPVIVEDTGLYIKALNNFPGALIRWMLKAIGNDGICKIINSYDDRSAYAETCICFYDGKQLHTFSGKIKGSISEIPRGNKGFGWDPIFIPKGYTKTFAEMDEEEKNKISMRRKALEKLRNFLLNK